MKIRHYFIGYTAVMLLIFLYMLHSFSAQSEQSRDMVYYNEQQILIEEAIENGDNEVDVEKEYGCEILLRSDEKYEVKLQKALQKEALVLDYFKDDDFSGKIIWNEKESQYEEMKKDVQKTSVLILGLVFLAGYFLLALIHFRMLRPFQKLQKFSQQIAKGNLDIPLEMERGNYFGTFTESFDIMREELKRARESEYQANQSKKELMAELSHDIKTPIATIQATCEVMQMKEKNEDTLEKVKLIDGKAKMIHKLVNNLFHATLEELTVLKVEPVEESSLCIEEMFLEVKSYGELTVTGKIPECLVYMDKLRLQQVIDNCLNNSWKYAGTPIEVEYKEVENGIQIRIKDQGAGVDEEELPLILEKFYRGKKAKGKEGSGLGLYLAKLFMEKMQGDLEYYNEDGFVVQLFLKKV